VNDFQNKNEKENKINLSDLLPFRRSLRNIGKPKVDYSEKPIVKNNSID
jgi:hypothetical protein